MGQREQCRYVFIGAEGRETYTFNSSVKELIEIEREEEERAETERERERADYLQMDETIVIE